MKKEITFKELQTICEEWIEKQDKLELYRDYNDYLEPDQVKDFLSYVETEIEKWNMLEPASYLYDWFCYENRWAWDWFNSYEHDSFYEAFVKPFIEQHPEYEDQEDEVDEILRELMYDMDLYDSNIEHFDKDYNFYLLTDPEKTYELYDGSYPFIETKHKYLKSLQRSQWRTANSTSMLELTRSGWYNGLWICIMLNTSLFDIINIMKSNRLTVRKWTDVYMFNPYIWTWGDTTELTSDWTFKFILKEIWIWVDNARKWPWWYTPEEVYWRYHPAFDKNKVLSHFKK